MKTPTVKDMDTPNSTSTEAPRKWYNNYTFPLIPVIKIREANEHNTKAISFHWMFLKFWTLDAFSFELEAVICDHWGIGVTAILPYLRIAVTIPPPPGLSMWIQRNLWRRP